MYYKIIRQPPDGKSVRGKLYRTFGLYDTRADIQDNGDDESEIQTIVAGAGASAGANGDTGASRNQAGTQQRLHSRQWRKRNSINKFMA